MGEASATKAEPPPALEADMAKLSTEDVKDDDQKTGGVQPEPQPDDQKTEDLHYMTPDCLQFAGQNMNKTGFPSPPENTPITAGERQVWEKILAQPEFDKWKELGMVGQGGFQDLMILR